MVAQIQPKKLTRTQKKRRNRDVRRTWSVETLNDRSGMAHRTDETGRPVRHAFLIGGAAGDRLVPTILFAASALTLFVFMAGWPQTPDGLFHLQRVRSLSEALAAGVLLPRWFPDFAFEYGHPILNYYAPGFYYPPALLHLAGLGVVESVRITQALLFGLSGLGMYALLRTWVSIPAALVGSLFYLAFPYRLYDLLIRGALPEFAAFLWLPLILLIAVRVAPNLQTGANGFVLERANSSRRVVNLLTGALIWAALVLTHNLTAMMVALTLAGLLVVAFLLDRFSPPSQRIGWQSMIWGLVPLFLGVLLAAWYIAPALLESAWVGIGAEPVSTGFTNHFVGWRQLFTWSPTYVYPSAAEPTVPLPAYLLVLVVVGLFVLPIVYRTSLLQPLVFALTMILVAVWLTTESSAFLWQATAPVLGKLQFPWRWQTIIALGVGLLAAVIVEWLLRIFDGDDAKSRLVGWVIVISAICYAILYGVAGLDYPQISFSDDDVTQQQMWAFDAEFGQIGMTWTGEFLPRWVSEQRWAIGREPSDGSSASGLPGVDLSVALQQLSYTDAKYRVEATEETTLIWHRFYFPSWQVTVDGELAETAPIGDLGLLSVRIPPGQHEVLLAWSTTPAVMVGRLLALVGWLALLALLWYGRARRDWIIGWVLAGAFVLAIGLLPARQVATEPVGADYGAVRLEAALADSGVAGETATVQLFWLVLEPSPPLNAFVHLVDDAGAVVAQDDAPLAGDYTPWQRWTPGLLLQHRHEILLPADLPPGDYRLKAGIYEPGHADAPLMPNGQDDPRLDIGSLEVHP